MGGMVSTIGKIGKGLLGGLSSIFSGGGAQRALETGGRIAQQFVRPQNQPDWNSGEQGPMAPSSAESMYGRGVGMYHQGREGFGGALDSWNKGDYGGALRTGFDTGQSLFRQGRDMFRLLKGARY